MKCYKVKGTIIFDFEDGKTATYDMNTGETIGKMGKPVKNLCSALTGYDIKEILDAFEDTKYRDFLLYLDKNFSPRTYSWRSGYTSRVKNLGTLLKYANDYKVFEQHFIAGLDADCSIRTPLKDVPKGLLKLCRAYGKKLTDYLIIQYQDNPDLYNMIFSMDVENISDDEKWNIASCLCSNGYGNASKLISQRNYNLRALFNYIDYLCTFEGLTANTNLLREIGDYANMMSQISEKYEKYPRYFLSTHRIAARNYARLKQEFSEQLFAKRIKPEYEITHGDYKFIYPKCTQDIKDEAVQQQNCVASYIDRVINGDCDILFLRKKDTPEKSAVTIEVRNGKIVQAFQAYNMHCTEEQQEAVDAFNKKFAKNV